jgi:hypothetical protein
MAPFNIYTYIYIKNVPLWPFMPISSCSQLPCVSHLYHTRSPLSQNIFCKLCTSFVICSSFLLSPFTHQCITQLLSLLFSRWSAPVTLSLSFSQSLLTQSLSLSLSQSPLRCSQMKTQI